MLASEQTGNVKASNAGQHSESSVKASLLDRQPTQCAHLNNTSNDNEATFTGNQRGQQRSFIN
jgi:hypothetical protein